MSDNVQYLDVDAVLPIARKVVTIGGVQHSFKEPSVEALLIEYRQNKALKESVEKGEIDPEKMIEAAIDFIDRSFPTIGRETLNTLRPQQISAIRRLIETELEAPEEVKEAEGNA